MDAKDASNGRANGESAASNNNKAATKAIRSLLSIPHNRTCADCKSALVDLSQIHASFCPKGRQILDHSKSSRVACFSDFGLTHQSFAPPNLQKENVIKYGTSGGAAAGGALCRTATGWRCAAPTGLETGDRRPSA